ncbi:MAG: hypothetical protein ACP5PN_01990 [Steroidobacteraceae bacterium]
MFAAAALEAEAPVPEPALCDALPEAPVAPAAGAPLEEEALL